MPPEAKVAALMDAAYSAVKLLGSAAELDIPRKVDHANQLIAVHDGLVEAILAIDPEYEAEQEQRRLGGFPGEMTEERRREIIDMDRARKFKGTSELQLLPLRRR